MNTTETRNAKELLDDPTVLVVSLEEAAQLLGISRSTAWRSQKATGEVCSGVPVLRSGSSIRVPTSFIRKAIGLDPIPTPKGKQ